MLLKVLFRKLHRIVLPSSVTCVKFVAQSFQSLVVTLVNTRLDYGALIGLPVYLSRRLQSVLNAAARLIFNLRRFDHVSDALISHKITIPARERWNKDQKALLPENSRAVYTDGSGGPLGAGAGIYFGNLAEDHSIPLGKM